jgi:hypothetical protein
VPQPAVRSNVHQSLDVRGNLAPQIALDPIIARNHRRDPADFVISQVFHPGIRIYTCCFENVIGAGAADPENVGKADFHTFFPRQVNA